MCCPHLCCSMRCRGLSEGLKTVLFMVLPLRGDSLPLLTAIFGAFHFLKRKVFSLFNASFFFLSLILRIELMTLSLEVRHCAAELCPQLDSFFHISKSTLSTCHRMSFPKLLALLYVFCSLLKIFKNFYFLVPGIEFTTLVNTRQARVPLS